jgi:hypothetical protein
MNAEGDVSEVAGAGRNPRWQELRALWFGAQATPGDTPTLALEFYYSVGDLLEGRPIEEIARELKHIAKDEVLVAAKGRA